MSSTESSGTPAEGSATPPAPAAEFPTFGTTRGSGLARGKRPSTGPAASTTAAPSDYKPTAIEVVSAPREYSNPFAPAEPAPTEQPAASVASPVERASPELVERAIETPKSETSIPPAPVARFEESAAPAELNILPPAEQKTAPAQTWESEGFTSQREPRRERASRREEPAADEPVDIASIPPQFLYVRPGVTYVPTPRNWGGAPRERRPERAAEGAPRREEPRDELSRLSETSSVSAPAKSGGFLGWLKSLFGGSSESEPVTAGAGEQRREGGDRRHRGGRGGRGGQGGGGHRRHRGGRGGRGGPRSEGSRQGGI